MSKRDFYFDNAKFILILFVVFGHIISPLKSGHEVLYSTYKFIFLFHMPAFILISGFFSKNFHKPGYIKKSFKKLLIPYLIFQIIYCFYYYFTGYEDQFSFSLFQPHWTLWFLLSLFCWHIMLIPFARLGKYGFVVAIALGVAVGYFSHLGSYLSIDRTFIFFPLFYLGYLLKKEHFVMLRQKVGKLTAVPVLVGIFMSCYFFLPDHWTGWLLGSKSYELMGFSGWDAGLYRLMFYAAMFLATFSVLALIPERQLSFTDLGRQTLYIYLLHGFFIKTINLFPYYENIGHFDQYIVLFVVSVVLCYFLASRPVRLIARPLVEVKLPKPRDTTA